MQKSLTNNQKKNVDHLEKELKKYFVEKMSESDETVCGNESEEENIENSPSILSNWRKDGTVFSAQKDEKSRENNTGKERQEDLNKNVLNCNVPSPETEISPEFPLITRGLKRKEDFDKTDNVTPTDVQSKTNSMEIPDDTRWSSSTEPENISGITDSQTTDDDKRLEKLKTVEELLNEMKMKSERNGNTYNLEDIQNAKAQLADIQKVLIESNHKNQEKRKMILSDAENTQQLSEEKKLMIVNLANKQRILLEAFKKYKNLVQKLKAMKELNNTSISSVEISPQIQSTSKSSVALPNSRSEQPPSNSIRCSSQNRPTSTSQGEESTSTFRQHPNCSPLSPNSHNSSTTSKANESIPRVVLPNTANPGLTKAIQQGSVKLIVLQNQPNNLSQISSQTQTNSRSRISTVSESRLSTISQNAPPSVLTHHSDATFLTGLNSSTTVSIQPDMTQSRKPNMKQSLPQTHTTVSTATSQSSKAPTTYVNVASLNQRNQHSSLIRPTTMNQTIMPSNLSSNQVTTAKTFSQSIGTSSHLPVPSQSQPVLPGLSTSKPQTIGTSTPSFPRSRINQTTMRSSVTANPELSLQTLVKKGILAPGKNVLTTTSEGKLYSASLSDKGTIISAGGEGFTSPRSWVKAILGSKRKVRNELAWKMVSYKNKPLLDQAYILTPEPTKTTETSINLNLEANEHSIQTSISQRNTRREPINTTKALKALLSNCQIIGITKEELLSSEQNIWDNVDMESVNDNIVKALDF